MKNKQSWLRASMGKGIEGYSIIDEKVTPTEHVYFYLSEDRTRAVVGFDQTEGAVDIFKLVLSADWIENLKAWKKSFSVGTTEWRAHAGFVREYLSVRSWVLDIIRKFSVSLYNIVVSGFSQGAAVATLCFRDLMHVFKNIGIQGFAYASPRVYSLFSAMEFEHELEKCDDCSFIRITWEGDAVTGQPPFILNYKHVGEEVFIGGGDHKVLRNNKDVHNQDKYLEYIESNEVAA